MLFTYLLYILMMKSVVMFCYCGKTLISFLSLDLSLEERCFWENQACFLIFLICCNNINLTLCVVIMYVMNIHVHVWRCAVVAWNQCIWGLSFFRFFFTFCLFNSIYCSVLFFRTELHVITATVIPFMTVYTNKLIQNSVNNTSYETQGPSWSNPHNNFVC